MSSAEELKAKGNKALQSGNVKEWYNIRNYILWKYQLLSILLIIEWGHGGCHDRTSIENKIVSY